MSDQLTRLLESREWLLADGATGTGLFAMGLVSGDCPELWNIEHLDRIARLHAGFIEAGSDIILTNSYGGTSHRLKLHRAEDRVAELNRAAARIARETADAAPRTVVVAGSIGPTGELFQPLGPLPVEAGAEAFAEQAQALARGGADVLWIETMSSVDEVRAAVRGARTTDLPIVFTVSFDTNGCTMMGVSPPDLVGLAHEIEPRPMAFGANCGVGASEVVACLLAMHDTLGSGDIVVAKANCGVPEFVDGEIRYNGTPALMAEYARLVRNAGARIIGGCCGTTPEHLRAMRAALESHTPGQVPDIDTVVKHLGEISRGARARMWRESMLPHPEIAGPPGPGEAGEGRERRGQRRRRTARED